MGLGLGLGLEEWGGEGASYHALMASEMDS